MRKTARKIKADIQTDYGAFPVVFEREPDMGGYMATAPKVKGMATWGKTLLEAKRMAKEAIECSVEGEVLIAAEKEGFVSLRRQRVHA